MTEEQDLVLIHFEEKPVIFARIEDIRPDVKRDWYQVKLLLLQVPIQTVTWILREAYINGETFTMNGKNMRLEKVVTPKDDDEGEPDTDSNAGPSPKPGADASPAKVISISDRKRK